MKLHTRQSVFAQVSIIYAEEDVYTWTNCSRNFTWRNTNSTLFQKPISRTFPGINMILTLSHAKISISILLAVCHTYHIVALSITHLHNFPGPVALVQDFPVLENATIKFQDFQGFPGPIRILKILLTADQFAHEWMFSN